MYPCYVEPALPSKVGIRDGMVEMQVHAINRMQSTESLNLQGRVKWAMAGRNQKKLEMIRSHVAEMNPECKVCCNLHHCYATC